MVYNGHNVKLKVLHSTIILNGLKFTEVAKLAGMYPATLVKKIKGTSDITLREMTSLRDVVAPDMQVDDLFPEVCPTRRFKGHAKIAFLEARAQNNAINLITRHDILHLDKRSI